MFHSYRARARPRTPAAPARLIVIPVGAAPPSALVDAADPDADAEAEDEAASEPVAVEEEDESVAEVESVEDEASEDDAPEDEAPELEAPVEVAEAVLGALLPLELVISAEMDDAKEG